MDTDKHYSSSILYTPIFNSADDIIVSLMHTDFATENFGFLMNEDGGAVLQEDNSELLLNISKGHIDGLSVFLVNADPGNNETYNDTFTGGGINATNNNHINPGMGLVRDNIFTSVSAVSGITLITALDSSGRFAKINALDQFKDGSASDIPNAFSVRTVDRGSTITNQPTAFPYKGSITNVVNAANRLEKTFSVLSIGFKRHLQEVQLYDRRDDGILTSNYTPIQTDIPLHLVPKNVRIGISYSGRMPMEIKNITVNAGLSA